MTTSLSTAAATSPSTRGSFPCHTTSSSPACPTSAGELQHEHETREVARRQRLETQRRQQLLKQPCSQQQPNNEFNTFQWQTPHFLPQQQRLQPQCYDLCQCPMPSACRLHRTSSNASCEPNERTVGESSRVRRFGRAWVLGKAWALSIITGLTAMTAAAGSPPL